MSCSNPTVIRTLKGDSHPCRNTALKTSVSKRAYAFFLQAASGKQDATIDAALRAIDRFETSTNRKPFSRFHVEQARSFRAEPSRPAGRERASPQRSHGHDRAETPSLGPVRRHP